MTACEVATCGQGSAASTVLAALQYLAAAQCLIGEPWPPQAHVTDGSRFDFVVVGAGTAGATLAARLADLEQHTVLVIEAGGDPPQESVIPGFRNTLKGSEFDWQFKSVDDNVTSQSFQDGSQRHPRGRLLGGSGSINDMVYSRGFPVDYDEWAQTLGHEWNYTNVLEYFKKTEHLTDEKIINNPELMRFHGRGGEIEVTGLNESTHETDMFLEAYEELGFPIVYDMTYPYKIGAGRFSHTIKGGRRDGSLTGLLNVAAKKNNLFVLKHSLVTKIIMEEENAVGVEVNIKGQTVKILANKEIIVSAGTFNTPKLLLLSGIGPKEHLEDIGIVPVVDLPVGNNLQDHVMVLNYVAAHNGTCSSDEVTTYKEMVRYLFDQTGSYSRTNTMGVYIGSEKDTQVPEFAIYPTCMPMGTSFYDGCLNVLGFKLEICQQLADVNLDYELISLAVVHLKPKSRGRVRLSSVDPQVPPSIYTNTFSNEEDLEGYPRATKIAASIVETNYFKRMGAFVVDLNVPGCDDLEELELVKCKSRSMATSAWHAVGTAAMGSVLDPHFRVKGVSNLRVVDASVMPSVTRGNTNAPVVMIAEKAADYIKGIYR